MHNSLEALSAVCPHPFIVGIDMGDGFANKQPACCRSCLHRECASSNVQPGEHNACSNGLSYYVSEWDTLRLTLNGLICEEKNNVVGGTRRKDLKRLWVKHNDVRDLLLRLRRIEQSIGRECQEAAKESISFVHDIRSSVSIVLSITEDIIARLPGGFFGEKIAGLRKSDPLTFTLYQSINFLTEQLGLADVISNPESISYGRKSDSKIHPFVFKMVKLFEPRAKQRGISIIIEGSTDVSVSTYQSFQLVPLVILDNGVKYADKNTPIYVRFAQSTERLELRVVSYGDVVPEADRERIFLRHVRGGNAEGRHPHGTGLGLHLATQIAKAHGYSIEYECDKTRRENTFTLFIPKNQWSADL